MNENLFCVFKQAFDTLGQKQAIKAVGDVKPYSFTELDIESARMAAALVRLGLNKGDRVLAQIDKSVESLILYLACLRRGVVFIPLNTAYTETELVYFIRNSTPRLLVCRPQDYVGLVELGSQMDALTVRSLQTSDNSQGSLLAEVDNNISERNIVATSRDDVAAILYTSGTTGLSKGAMLTHGNLSSNVASLTEAWGWQQSDVLLHALPIFHAHGLFVATHLALANGSSMIFLPRFDLDEVVELLPSSTVFMGVPTFYTRLLQRSEFSAESCQNMRLFVSGSAPLLADTFAEFEARCGFRILERYGMTETVMICSNPLHGDRDAGTVGFALPGISVRVVDASGKVSPAGEVGELQLKGPNVFKGYWQMPEKTAEEFTSDGFFCTGDLATMSEQGRVAIVGRNKDLIISGGYNVYPKEIESYIDKLAGVQESAVIGLAHRDFGEMVAAVVVSDGTTPLNEDSIIAPLSGQIARFKQPKRVFFIDELPRNAMGKVQKNQLRERYFDVPDA